MSLNYRKLVFLRLLGGNCDSARSPTIRCTTNSRTTFFSTRYFRPSKATSASRSHSFSFRPFFLLLFIPSFLDLLCLILPAASSLRLLRSLVTPMSECNAFASAFFSEKCRRVPHNKCKYSRRSYYYSYAPSSFMDHSIQAVSGPPTWTKLRPTKRSAEAFPNLLRSSLRSFVRSSRQAISWAQGRRGPDKGRPLHSQNALEPRISLE